MDCDRILVLSDGEVVEFGQPYELLCDKSGVLTELAEQTGEASKDRLFQIAKASYFERLNRKEESLKYTQKIGSLAVCPEDTVASL